MQSKLEATLSARTVANHHIILCRALEIAFRYGYVEKNVARLVSAPPSRRYKVDPLTPEEMKKFLATCQGHPLNPLFVALSATGMRIGEALGLSWKHIDLEAGTVRIDQMLYRTPLASREDGEVFALE